MTSAAYMEEARCAGFPTYQIGPRAGARILPRSQRCGMGALRYVPSGHYEGAIGGIYSTTPRGGEMRGFGGHGLGGFRGGYGLEVQPSRRDLDASALMVGAMRGGSPMRAVAGLAGTADRVGTACNLLGTTAQIVASIGMTANTTDPQAQYTVGGFMEEQSRYDTYQTVGQVATGANTICQSIVTASQSGEEVPAGTPTYSTVPFASTPKATQPAPAPAPADTGLVMKVGIGLGAAILAGGIGYLLLG